MRFCTIYPNTHNVNLIKDMGMIPYKLNEQFGVNSWIACYQNGDYPYLGTDVNGLKLDFIEKKYNNYILDGCRYIRKNAKNIDVLNIYHITAYSMAYAFLYKILNKEGKIYLKLDCSEKLVQRLDAMNTAERIAVKKFLNKTDLISVEQERLVEPLKQRFNENRDKLVNITNGIDVKWFDGIEIGTPKRKQFLHVARLGAEEKKSEEVIKGFVEFAKHNDQWELCLVGPMEKEFERVYSSIIKGNPLIASRIHYKGQISDRKEYYSVFNESAAFILNSEFESFAFVLIEAAFLMDYIISTDVGIIDELVDCCTVELLDSYRVENVSNAMSEIAKKYSDKGFHSKEMVEDRYNYNNIIKKLKDFIDKKMNSCK